MSLIPSNAISIASTLSSAQTNQAIHARRVQAQKNDRHAEDVQELDDTAVSSVDDEAGRKNQQDPKEEKPATPEDLLDIAALKELPLFPTATHPPIAPAPPTRLDISA